MAIVSIYTNIPTMVLNGAFQIESYNARRTKKWGISNHANRCGIVDIYYYYNYYFFPSQNVYAKDRAVRVTVV